MAAKRTLLLTLIVAWIAALSGLVWMIMAAGIGLRHFLFLPTNLSPVMTMCVLLSVGSAVVGVVSLFGARRRLRIGVAGAVGWGALGAVYGAVGARSMLINMNPPIPFAIYAPSYAEAFLVLLIGLTGALVCLGLLVAKAPPSRPHHPRHAADEDGSSA